MANRNPNAMGEFKIELPRTYDAAPDRVFRAWTDPVSAKAWLAEGGDIVMDPRPDGLFYFGMMHKGIPRPHYGRYLRVESPRLLEFTWVSESTYGKESVVTIELVPRGKQTELRLTHEGLPDEEMAHAHRGGWTYFLDALVDRLN
ncbi:MAG: SRPBCC domain-containing protein [Rhodanobacteraceae bacterium]